MAIAGQPERVIELSTLPQTEKEKLLKFILQETGQGYRVVAFAFKEGEVSQERTLGQWEFLALAVLSDPVRHGVKEAIAILNKASISTYMVTGDHPTTTDRIAKEIGLNSSLLTGSDIDKMNDKTLSDRLKVVKVFARIAPSQKQRIVTLLKKSGECVAVVGDGVNDAPAMKASNMGIAMGEIGTDLAKETADLILTDDNYIHLPDAIAIGRKALDNFRKGLSYYLSAKAILLSIFIIPLALGIPFPLAPIHIILTELLMDLASSTIFITETAEPDIMSKPTKKITNFLSKDIGFRILKNGTFLTIGILAVYLWIYYSTENIVLAQTSAFVTWLLGHILLALNLKQERIPLFKQGITSNRFGLFWLLSMITLSLVITTIPFFYPLLQTTALPWNVWVVILFIVIISTYWIEIIKNIRLKTKKNLMKCK
jgi:Ca2+-transporting ATPase